jgi:hypothetical protein
MYGAGLAQAGRAMQGRHRHHAGRGESSAAPAPPIAAAPGMPRAVPDAAVRDGRVRALFARFSRRETQRRKQPVGLDLR